MPDRSFPTLAYFLTFIFSLEGLGCSCLLHEREDCIPQVTNKTPRKTYQRRCVPTEEPTAQKIDSAKAHAHRSQNLRVQIVALLLYLQASLDCLSGLIFTPEPSHVFSRPYSDSTRQVFKGKLHLAKPPRLFAFAFAIPNLSRSISSDRSRNPSPAFNAALPRDSKCLFTLYPHLFAPYQRPIPSSLNPRAINLSLLHHAPRHPHCPVNTHLAYLPVQLYPVLVLRRTHFNIGWKDPFEARGEKDFVSVGAARGDDIVDQRARGLAEFDLWRGTMSVMMEEKGRASSGLFGEVVRVSCCRGIQTSGRSTSYPRALEESHILYYALRHSRMIGLGLEIDLSLQEFGSWGWVLQDRD